MNYIGFIAKYLGKAVGNDYIQFSDGWDYEVIICNNLVFRFPKNKNKILNMKREKQMLDIISQYVDIKVPQYSLVNGVCCIYPEISGVPLNKLNIPYTDDMLKDIVAFIKQLHSIPLEKFPFLQSEKESTDDDSYQLRNFVNGLKDKIQNRLKDKVPDATIENIHIYMEKLFFEYESLEKSFVHTDIQEKNIIYDPIEQKISGIIDFTDSRIGGIELDFCHFYDLGEDTLNKVITLYRGYEDKELFEKVFFLARRGVIFEIDNDELFESNFEYILAQLKKYKFYN